MTFEATPTPLHHLLFGESREETGGGPAFLVGGRRQRGPDQLDARQPQLTQSQVDARGVDLTVGVHAASPWLAAI